MTAKIAITMESACTNPTERAWHQRQQKFTEYNLHILFSHSFFFFKKATVTSMFMHICD